MMNLSPNSFLRKLGWHAQGGWADVVSVSGIPFLPFHFRGEGHLPQRDLAHVRPSALKKAREALTAFVQRLLATGH
jgi:hypothetical protein